MKQIQLIVNADDFGLSEEVNEAVVRAHQQGILTSCSLMVTGDAFAQAVRLARENPGLAVGLHLVTVMGKSVLPHEEIPSLVDRDKRFPSNPAVAGLKYFFSRKARRELRKEIAAQFEKFQSTGLALSHIDSHLHMHVHPVIFDAALDLAERCRARRMRVPDDDFDLWRSFTMTSGRAQAGYALVFRLLCSRMRRKLKPRGFAFVDKVYGNLQSGRMSEEYMLFILDRLRAGRKEVYFHPAFYESSDALPDKLQRQCLREFQILVSREVKDRIAGRGIELTSYPALEACP